MAGMVRFLLFVFGLLVAGFVNYFADWLPFSDIEPGDEFGPGGDGESPPESAFVPQPFSWAGLGRMMVTLGLGGERSRWLQFRGVAVALVSALGLVWLYDREGLTLRLVLLGALLAGLLLITVIDLEHRLVFLVTVIPTAIVALLYGGLVAERGSDANPWVVTLLGGVIQGALVFGLYMGGILYSKVVAKMRSEPLSEEAFGFGDVYISVAIGLAVGWPGITLALLITLFSGAAVGAVVLVISRLRGQYEVYMPYGPVLVFGALVILLWGREFADWYFGR